MKPDSDYYEAQQISSNADSETIHRVYRMMATRFHLDNPRTGNTETFLLLKRAYNVLSDPRARCKRA
jgi:DnaJ-class molecular chaperone